MFCVKVCTFSEPALISYKTRSILYCACKNVRVNLFHDRTSTIFQTETGWKARKVKVFVECRYIYVCGRAMTDLKADIVNRSCWTPRNHLWRIYNGKDEQTLNWVLCQIRYFDLISFSYIYANLSIFQSETHACCRWRFPDPQPLDQKVLHGELTTHFLWKDIYF